ncbi:MAG: hypothetical protein ACFFDN_17720, partial [Candidatus Hodarchaeota archaeon]
VNTGSAGWCKERPSFLPSGAVGGPDFSRLFSGSQGSLGVVTDLIIKAKYLLKIKKIIFIPYEKIENVLDLIYKILYFDKGREFLGISQKNLALILKDGQKNIDEKGGTAISISYVTKRPILFLGTG